MRGFRKECKNDGCIGFPVLNGKCHLHAGPSDLEANLREEAKARSREREHVRRHNLAVKAKEAKESKARSTSK